MMVKMVKKLVKIMRNDGENGSEDGGGMMVMNGDDNSA